QRLGVRTTGGHWVSSSILRVLHRGNHLLSERQTGTAEPAIERSVLRPPDESNSDQSEDNACYVPYAPRIPSRTSPKGNDPDTALRMQQRGHCRVWWHPPNVSSNSPYAIPGHGHPAPPGTRPTLATAGPRRPVRAGRRWTADGDGRP